MKDTALTKNQLIQELETIRQLELQILEQLSELETQDSPEQTELIPEKPANIIFSIKPSVKQKVTEQFQFPEHPQLRAIFDFIEVNRTYATGTLRSPAASILVL